MNQPFDRIGVIGKHADSSVSTTVLQLAAYLNKRGHNVHLEDATSKLIEQQHPYPTSTMAELALNRDLVIVVGGDGTLLHAARTFSDGRIPLLGINLGRLGFLTDVSCEDMEESLNRILSGDYEIEQRSLLKITINNGEEGEPIKALNDVVIHKWNSARLIEFETYINGQLVTEQRSDGMIIATPTGSTAYALSGGGPILYPSLNAMVMVPICPHTLSNRPIVVDGDSEVEIRIAPGHHKNVRITCDGLKSLEAEEGQRILIRKAKLPIRLIHPSGHDHFSVLRAKLGWGEHPTR